MDIVDHANAHLDLAMKLAEEALRGERDRKALIPVETSRFCSECLDPIHPERLKSLPGVRLCTECQSDQERRS